MKEVELPESKVEILSLKEPPARESGDVVGEGSEAVPELVRRLRERALL